MTKLASTLLFLLFVLHLPAQNCQVFTGDVNFTESVFNGTVIIQPTGDLSIGSQYNKPEEKLELIYAYIEFQLEQIDDPAVEGMNVSERLDYVRRKEEQLATEQAQIEANRKELVVQEKRVKDIEQKFQANIDAESRRIENLVASNAAKLAKDPLIKEKIEEKLAQKDRIVESTKACLLNNFSLVPIQDVATGNISYGFSLDEIRRDPNYVLIDDYHEGMARVRRNNKFGFYDKKGQLIIPFKYDYAEAFAGGRALVQNLGKWFLIDKNGQNIIALSEQQELSSPVTITTICPNVYAFGHSTTGPASDRYFYYNEVGGLVKWNELNSFNENGIAFFSKWGSLFGAVNTQGKILLPAAYATIKPSKAYPGYFLTEKSYNKKGLIDAQGRTILPARFYQIYDYDFWDFPKYELVVAGVSTYSNGVFDLSGRQIIAPEYRDITLKDNFIVVQKDDKKGLFTLQGKPILDASYDELKIKSNRIEFEQDSLWGMANLKGEVLVPPKYRKISDYKTGKLLSVQNKVGQYGVIDQKGKEILPAQYGYVRIYDDALNVIVVSQEGKRAVFDTKGEQLSSWLKSKIFFAHAQSGRVSNSPVLKFVPDHAFIYDDSTRELHFIDAKQEIHPLANSAYTFFHTRLNKFYKLDDKTYAIGSYKAIRFFNEEYTLSSKSFTARKKPQAPDQNGNILLSAGEDTKAYFYLINKQFQQISENYDRINVCDNGMYLIEQDDKLGFIDAQGQPVTRLRFHTAHPYTKDNFAIVAIAGNQFGIIDQYGAEMVVPVFSTIDKTRNGYALHYGNKRFSLDEKLQCVLSNCEDYQEIVKAYHQQKE